MSNDPRPFGDNFIPVIFVDRIIHTKQNPYCTDETCPCHNEKEDEAFLFYTIEACLNGAITARDGAQVLTACGIGKEGRP